MTSRSFFFSGIVILAMLRGTGLSASTLDWPVWRGPHGKGVACSSAVPPGYWGEGENVKWKALVPGRGLSSPVVVEDLVVLTTATEEAQFVLAFDRSSGAVRWKTRVHEGGLPEKLHRKNSAASSTAASDGEFFYVVFHHQGRIMLSALDRSGGLAWQRDTGEHTCDYRFGYAASPALHGGLLYVASEFTEGGYLAAFRASDGSEVWRVPRKIKTSFSSPVVAEVAGREQLLLSGGDKIASYDPASGDLLWEVEGSSSATCGTMVWSDDTVFASGGFPNRETIAVRADGSGDVLWKHEDKSYEQSLLYHDGHVYTLNDNGIAVCWDAETGEEKWKVRLGGPVSASPVLAGGVIYAMNERGITFVFRPNPNEFEKLAELQLGDEGFATPVFVGREVFLRTAVLEGESREEFLYCLAEE